MLVEAQTRHGRQFLNLSRAMLVWEDRLYGGSVIVVHKELVIEASNPPAGLLAASGVPWVALTRAPLEDGATPRIWVNPLRVRGVRVFRGLTHVDFAGRWEHVLEPLEEVAARVNDALGRPTA